MFAPNVQENDKHRSFDILVEIGVLFFLIIIDYVIKILVVRHSAYLCNSGIAFSMQLPPACFVALWSVIVMILGYYRYTIGTQGKFMRIPFVLIFAGAIGNVIDRIHYGCVIDYVPFLHISMFNFADVLITVGAGLLLFHTIRKHH